MIKFRVQKLDGGGSVLIAENGTGEINSLRFPYHTHAEGAKEICEEIFAAMSDAPDAALSIGATAEGELIAVIGNSPLKYEFDYRPEAQRLKKFLCDTLNRLISQEV